MKRLHHVMCRISLCTLIFFHPSQVRNCIGYSFPNVGPEWMTTDSQPVVGLIRTLAQMLFFAIICGLAFGWTTCRLLRLVYNDR